MSADVLLNLLNKFGKIIDCNFYFYRGRGVLDRVFLCVRGLSIVHQGVSSIRVHLIYSVFYKCPAFKFCRFFQIAKGFSFFDCLIVMIPPSNSSL